MKAPKRKYKRIHLKGVLFLDSKALSINGKVFSISFVNEIDERTPQGMGGDGN